MAYAQRLPRNSFVNKPVYSTWQLVEHVKKDPVVAKRYMKHFGMQKDQLIRYLLTLRTARMPRTEMMQVYNVDKWGIIRSRLLRVSKGTLVWIDPQNRPVLIRSCGNPTKYGPPPEEWRDVPRFLIENKIVPEEAVTPEELVEVQPDMALEDYIPPVGLTPPDTEVPPPVVYRSRPSFIPIPLPIPFTRTRTKPCDVIPGPAAVVSFGGTAIAALLRRRRRK